MGQTFEDSHFKWTVQYRYTTLRDCDELIGKIDDCLRDNPGYMEIEAVLFKAFLYMAHWRKPKYRKSKEAKKCLDIAFNKINECHNDEARNGYSLVGYTLYWQIEQNQEIDSRANEYGKCISAIVKTPECSAFVDATRAFALSFLGIAREEESLWYYDQALSMYRNNINWMFGFAHRLGKKGRREGDYEALETEKHIFEEILERDPKHARAMLFLAQNKFHNGDETAFVLKPMFNEALALAKKDGHSHTKVAVRVARFFRLTYNYKRALEILNDAEHSIGKDPNEMLFHQKAMVYLTKYRKYDILHVGGFAKDYLLVGEKEGDKKSLLQESLIHLDEAVKRCDSGGMFRLDRAYVYEQLDMYEEADDEYIRLVDASQDFHNSDRLALYLKYGLYLKRRGTLDLMMNYLSKGIELFKTQIYDDSILIDGETYLALSCYDSTNASKCSSTTSNVRAEGLYRLGWLRLLFSDVTLEYVQDKENVLSKNNPTGKTHLQLYQQAYDEIENNANDNPAPIFLSGIIDGLIICHLQEGRKENLSKADLQLHYYNRNSASEKLADLKLAQCEQYGDKEHPRLLLEAVQEGSLDACKRLCEWFEGRASPSLDPDVLRYCVQIQICLSRDKLMHQQYNCFWGMYVHTLINTADLYEWEMNRKTAVLSSVQSILKRRDDDLDELREVYLGLLNSSEEKSAEAVICSKVILCARFALAHAIASFQRRFCRWYAPKLAKSQDSDKSDSVEFHIVKAAPYIKEKTLKRDGGTIVTPLKEAVQKELRGMLEAAGPKKRSMPGFSLRFPDLFEYLTSIQPAANPDGSYDWLVALNILTNKHKHEEPLSQMEYTVSVGKDHNNDDIRRTFNIEGLAQTARFGVEKIVMEFREVEKKFDMFDERIGLRFAEMKCLRINRYTAT